MSVKPLVGQVRNTSLAQENHGENMNRRRSIGGWAILVFALLTLSGCFRPNPAAAPPTPTPVESPDEGRRETDTGWQPVTRGVEWREMAFYPNPETRRRTLAYIVRIDPAAVTLRVHYAPGAPRAITAWAEQTGAPFLINGGFFSPEYVALGLLVSDGMHHGQSYNDFGGMFQVTGGRARVRALALEPYFPGEPLDQAVQAFPMLLNPGGAPAYPDDPDDRLSRRTVVGQDRAGRLVFVAVPAGGLTLYESSQWLAGADFDLDVALNLDGGGSTALYLKAGDFLKWVPSVDPLPVVIAAYLR